MFALWPMEMNMKVTYPIVEMIRSIHEATSRFAHVIFPLGILALVFSIR